MVSDITVLSVIIEVVDSAVVAAGGKVVISTVSEMVSGAVSVTGEDSVVFSAGLNPENSAVIFGEATAMDVRYPSPSKTALSPSL